MFDFIPKHITAQIRLEKDFQSFIGKCIKEEYGDGWPYHKMSDQAICKKPCDCFFVDKIGRTYFMELKMIDAYTLNLKKLEPQQVEFLSKISNLQSGPVMTYALVLVYSKKLKEWKILHWSEIEKNLLDDGSVQVFERLK